MKNMITKTANIFKDNVWLLVVTIIILILIGLAGWKLSLSVARKTLGTNSINVTVGRGSIY